MLALARCDLSTQERPSSRNGVPGGDIFSIGERSNSEEV